MYTLHALIHRQILQAKLIHWLATVVVATFKNVNKYYWELTEGTLFLTWGNLYRENYPSISLTDTFRVNLNSLVFFKVSSRPGHLLHSPLGLWHQEQTSCPIHIWHSTIFLSVVTSSSRSTWRCFLGTVRSLLKWWIRSEKEKKIVWIHLKKRPFPFHYSYVMIKYLKYLLSL